MNIGDIVVNSSGWQGKIIQFGGERVLVQYASVSQWESRRLLYVVGSAATGAEPEE